MTDNEAASYIGDISPEQANYLVADLNQQIYEKVGDETVLTFESIFNGYYTIINWCGVQIWCSEDDDRTWISVKDEEEKADLKEYILRKMAIIKYNVSKIILK